MSQTTKGTPTPISTRMTGLYVPASVAARKDEQRDQDDDAGSIRTVRTLNASMRPRPEPRDRVGGEATDQ